MDELEDFLLYFRYYPSIQYCSTAFINLISSGFRLQNLPPVQVYQVMAEWSSSLVGRICFDESICSNITLYRALKSLWNVHQTLHVVSVGRNRFLLKFRYYFDMQRVLFGGPWSVFGFLMVLKPWSQFVRPIDMILEREAFWVKLLQLPTVHVNEDSIWEIASEAGMVLFVDPAFLEGIRVRVLIDVSRPLKRGTNSPVIGGIRSWIGFQFEKLPNQFCDLCYRLGHKMTGCPEMGLYLAEENVGVDLVNALEPVDDPLEIVNLNINEQLIDPYGDGDIESEGSSDDTLDIILNSSSYIDLSNSNNPDFNFLASDPCRIILNSIPKENFTNPIPLDELQRYQNGKRSRNEEVGSSSMCIQQASSSSSGVMGGTMEGEKQTLEDPLISATVTPYCFSTVTDLVINATHQSSSTIVPTVTADALISQDIAGELKEFLAM